MLYAILCTDKPDSLELRMANREAHLEYARASTALVFGGPFLNDGKMCGSMVVVEGDSIEVANDFVANDPYGKAGLFADVTIREWKKVLG